MLYILTKRDTCAILVKQKTLQAILMKNLDICLLLDFYGDLLSDTARENITLYYNEDLSLAEIAETAGITRQGVRDSIKRAEEQLIKFEEKLGLATRFTSMQDGIEEIKRMLEDIKNDIPTYSSKVEKIISKADEILLLNRE